MSEKFEEKVKTHLEESLDDLSPDISRRLQQARYAALEKAEKGSFIWSFYPKAATAVFAISVLSISLFLNVQKNDVTETVIAMETETEMEMLSSNDNLELMEDLEFIEWLVEFEEYAS